MAKWAEFCIVGVKYRHDRNSIAEVEAKPDTGESLGTSQKLSRQAVVKAIGEGTTFVTAYENDAGKFSKGEDVRVVEIQTEKFLRTDSNRVKADNLGELPEYV